MIAALVLELEGAGLLPVLVPVDDEPEDVVAAADEEAADEEVRVAMLMVVFRDNAVPEAAEPEAPAPVPAAPLAAVVVALPEAEAVLLLLLPEPPPITPPEAGFVPTVEVALTLALVAVDDDEEDVARAETARVGPEVAPPVRVIMPV